MKDSTLGGLMAAIFIVICIALGVLVENDVIQSKSEREHTHMMYVQDSIAIAKSARLDSLCEAAIADSVHWAQFLECSKDMGDAGCDSCFTAIYGYSLEER